MSLTVIQQPGLLVERETNLENNVENYCREIICMVKLTVFELRSRSLIFVTGNASLIALISWNDWAVLMINCNYTVIEFQKSI